MKQHQTIFEPRADERSPVRERWTALEPGHGDEAQAGALLRAAACVRPLGARQMASVAARLRATERRRPRPLLWQLAVAAALMLCGGALSASVARILRIGYFAQPGTEKSMLAVPPKVRHTSPGRPRPGSPKPATVEPGTSMSDPESEPAPEPESGSTSVPAPIPEAAHRLAVRTSRAVALREVPRVEPPNVEHPPVLAKAAPAPAPPTAASALAKESRLLALAITKLRQEGDAKQALILLEQYHKEFGPASALWPEANSTRIEALLRLKRHAQALVLLDAMTPATTGVGRELLVARAELRADKGRRTAALDDFDRLLSAGAAADPVTERALYGRATCRMENGDGAGARRDLETYLATFPGGRFARLARAALHPDLR